MNFEKVFFPYLLLKKKKYESVIWTNEDKYDKIDYIMKILFYSIIGSYAEKFIFGK